jgi:hypothetical protein
MKPMTSTLKFPLARALAAAAPLAGATTFFDAPLTVIAHRGGSDVRRELYQAPLARAVLAGAVLGRREFSSGP